MLVPGFYVPVLTGKLGELAAISRLPADIRGGLTPLLDLPPVRDPFPRDVNPATPRGEIEKILGRLRVHWGTDRRVLMDFDGMEHQPIDGAHVASWVAGHLSGVRVSAVISSRTGPDGLAAVLAHPDGFADVVLRLHVKAGVPTSEAREALDRLTEQARVLPQVTDLLVDLGQVPSDMQPEPVAAVLEALEVGRWRSVALASTSVPTRIDSDSKRRERRRDWWLFKQLWQAGHTGLAFADYSVTGPRPTSTEPVGPGAPTVRYSLDSALLIFKGKRARDGVYERGTSFPELCRVLLDTERKGKPVFAGPTFSWGDERFREYARTPPGPGVPKQWVSFATNHHLTLVVRQLADYLS